MQFLIKYNHYYCGRPTAVRQRFYACRLMVSTTFSQHPGTTAEWTLHSIQPVDTPPLREPSTNAYVSFEVVEQVYCVGSKRHSLQAVTNCCANCVEPARPQEWGPDLSFFGKPAMRTHWMAGAAPHKSGRCRD